MNLGKLFAISFNFVSSRLHTISIMHDRKINYVIFAQHYSSFSSFTVKTFEENGGNFFVNSS